MALLLRPGKVGTAAQVWSPTCALLRFRRAEQSSVLAAHREPSRHPPPASGHPPLVLTHLNCSPGLRRLPAVPPGQVRVLPVAASSVACREGGRADDPDPPPGGAAQPAHPNPPLPGAAVPARPLAAWGLASREARAAGRQSLAIGGPLHVHPGKPGQEGDARAVSPHPLPSSWPSRGGRSSSHSLHSAGSLPQLCV